MMPKAAPLTQEIVERFQLNTTRTYTHGRATYCDIFGKGHWLNYCFHTSISSPDSRAVNFSACDMHNDTGDDPTMDCSAPPIGVR
jgi:hypothetical protein